ncbi:hypothetical protein MUN88_17025 [Gracilibacillus caseinilyticus]|uniref:Uncharacterized protein n=1 Tax=Gracilibacillus caseinilyticus TaxID=2932256 RepID=A0ABY4EUT3_9BACI|nr:hypothetical protein [Gracilibacillus caseinilyticus]UOQ47735.1 hypothetical protein MUN88_17025 [Gracilibacillus caseinilyticus]
MNITPNDVWKLPHSHYLAFLKHNVTMDMQETEEGRDILKRFERVNNPRTHADYSAIRAFGGYSTQKVGDK